MAWKHHAELLEHHNGIFLVGSEIFFSLVLLVVYSLLQCALHSEVIMGVENGRKMFFFVLWVQNL